MQRVFKIIDEAEWARAVASGVFQGAAIDLADGYIHLSNAAQVETTARLHFHGREGLLLVAFDAVVFGQSLKWEASRGGDLFPHVHGTITPADALWAQPLPWTEKGHAFPNGWSS